MLMLLLLLPCACVQTVKALLPATAVSGEAAAELQEAAVQWGQQQGMSVRSAAAFARSCGLQ
jgi:hypothetical protein